jgi:hypothetical protein
MSTTEGDGKMIANVDELKYGSLLAATRPGIITNDAELERLTAEVNRLVTKGIKEDHLSAEEEKLLSLLTRLIEDYEQTKYSDSATTEAA